MRAIVSSLRRNALSQLRALKLPVSCRTRTTWPQCGPHHAVQRILKAPKERLYHTSHEEPTIYALSTANGRAAIAVIRVSGSACRQVRLASPHTTAMLTPFRYIKDYVPPRPSQSLDTRPCASCMRLAYLLHLQRY